MRGAGSGTASARPGRQIYGRIAAAVLAAFLLPLGAGTLRAQDADPGPESGPTPVLEGAAADAAGAEGTDLVPVSIGVLPFDRVGPPGASIPDGARRLADRLATRGVTRVVGPEGYAGSAVFAPAADQVQAWGAQTDVGALVAGRVTRIGQRISLDLRLRDTHSGSVLSTHVAEAARPDELDAAVDRLAEQIVREARAEVTRTPPVAAAAASPSRAPRPALGGEGAASPPPPRQDAAPARPGAPPQADRGDRSGEPAAAPAGAGQTQTAAVAEPSPPDAGGSQHASSSPQAGAEEPGFLGTGRSDEPINIRSDELEAFEEGGERRFVFRQDVEVRQGDLRLTSRHLEAFYPKGSSQPDRLEARGNVVLVQEGREARCDRAIYLRSEGRVVCLGDDAVLLQDGDRVRGKEIEFDLDTERLVVRGGADVELQSDGGGDGS